MVNLNTFRIALLATAALVVGPPGGRALSSETGSTLVLGPPIRSGRIAVVPIVAKRPLSPEKYITLSQATKLGLVEIVEVPGQAQVNTLEVRNRADLPLLLVAGELLLGGKQDRIVAKDTIIPKMESRQVPVFCVEHGRWESGKSSFVPADTLVPDRVRATASTRQDQGAVWDEVAKANAMVGAAPATGTLRATITDPQVRRAVDSAAEKLDRGLAGTREVVGAICWLDGQIHSADLFANPALFAANRAKLIRSYCADMVLSQHASSTPPNMTACRAFLAAIESSNRTLADRSRYDATFTVRNGRVMGYESGQGAFGGGLGGGMGGMGGGGFGHGTYRPGGR